VKVLQDIHAAAAAHHRQPALPAARGSWRAAATLRAQEMRNKQGGTPCTHKSKEDTWLPLAHDAGSCLFQPLSRVQYNARASIHQSLSCLALRLSWPLKSYTSDQPSVTAALRCSRGEACAGSKVGRVKRPYGPAADWTGTPQHTQAAVPAYMPVLLCHESNAMQRPHPTPACLPACPVESQVDGSLLCTPDNWRNCE